MANVFATLPAHPMFKPLVDIRARIYDMAHEASMPRSWPIAMRVGDTCSVGTKLPLHPDGLVRQAGCGERRA